VLSKYKPGGGRDPDAKDPDQPAESEGMRGSDVDEVEDMFGSGSRGPAANPSGPGAAEPAGATPPGALLPLPAAPAHPDAEARQ
jgi:hypothetical protein